MTLVMTMLTAYPEYLSLTPGTNRVERKYQLTAYASGSLTSTSMP